MPGQYKYELSDFEDDSKDSPYSVLTLEESLFLNDYLIKHKKINKITAP